MEKPSFFVINTLVFEGKIYCSGLIVNIGYMKDNQLFGVEGRIKEIEDGVIVLDTSEKYKSSFIEISINDIREISGEDMSTKVAKK